MKKTCIKIAYIPTHHQLITNTIIEHLLTNSINTMKNIYYIINMEEKMNRGIEYLIGGILCLIISIVFMIMHKRISAGVIASFVLFILGIVQAIRLRE